MDFTDFRRIRNKAGWTQQEVADYLGVRVTTVYRYESSRRKPRREHRQKYIELDKRFSE